MMSFLIVDDEDVPMKLLRAQGATQLFCGTTYRPLRGQGATEYLVLLAVVLVIALVAIALLGFFPGLAGGTQETQSKMYWQSAAPIAIVEWDAKAYASTADYTSLYLRIRNTGSYPIRITKLIANNQSISQIWNSSAVSISDYYYMAPGEEKYVGYIGAWPSLPAHRAIYLRSVGACTSSSINFCTAQSNCQNSTSAPGMVSISGFGFEYETYIEGATITKRQVGAKPLIVKCGPPF